MASLILKPGRERSLQRHHPWVFSGAVERVLGQPGPGETVDLLASDGSFLARGAYSPNSQIKVRVWTFEDQAVDEAFLESKVCAALRARESLHLANDTQAYRLVYAESDGLPGLIVDRYGETLVLQSLTTGIERWKAALAEILLASTGLKQIYERSDSDVRDLEGLKPFTGRLRGKGFATALVVREHGIQYRVDMQSGHKTGFYLDQRENRKLVRALSDGREVLDCFCYTGGFAINALVGGAASVVAVDASSGVLATGLENATLNKLEGHMVEWMAGDAFQVLRKFRDEGRRFDLIILDPPKFAPTSAHASKAARGYKDINRLGFLLLRSGGLLVTFSCSGGIEPALFQKIVASAALDAGVEAQIIGRMSQGPDHPIALPFPEGEYLKGLVCVVQRVGGIAGLNRLRAMR